MKKEIKKEVNHDDELKKHSHRKSIIVNGRLEVWSKRIISFEEVVVLAFGSYSDNPNTCYTVTYSRGWPPKTEGSMIKGQMVKVKSKMVFNVAATDKS